MESRAAGEESRDRWAPLEGVDVTHLRLGEVLTCTFDECEYVYTRESETRARERNKAVAIWLKPFGSSQFVSSP